MGKTERTSGGQVVLAGAALLLGMGLLLTSNPQLDLGMVPELAVPDAAYEAWLRSVLLFDLASRRSHVLGRFLVAIWLAGSAVACTRAGYAPLIVTPLVAVLMFLGHGAWADGQVDGLLQGAAQLEGDHVGRTRAVFGALGRVRGHREGDEFVFLLALFLLALVGTAASAWSWLRRRSAQ